MIEVNLIERKKGGRPVVVLGVDVRTVNFKLFGLAIILYYAPKNYLTSMWADEIRRIDNQIEILDAKAKTLSEELKSFDNVKKELEAYNTQIERLRGRSDQVDKILKEKTSPKRLLEVIARSVPADLWFNELVIKEDRTFELRGGAESYKSIGDLVNSLNETPYFRNSINLANSETKTEVDGSREIRTESFELIGRVESFEIVGR